MIKVYGTGASRWVKPYWLLKELDVAFEPVAVNLAQAEHRKPEFLALNPFGKVPALADGPFHLFESSAICTYLADKYADKGLIPPRGSTDRALCDQWTSFAVSELEQPLWRIIKHRYVYPEARRSPAEIELATDDFSRICATLEKQISSANLVGGRFSIADIAVTYTLRWATLPSMPEHMLAKFPGLCAYMETHLARPKFPHELYPART